MHDECTHFAGLRLDLKLAQNVGDCSSAPQFVLQDDRISTREYMIDFRETIILSYAMRIVER